MRDDGHTFHDKRTPECGLIMGEILRRKSERTIALFDIFKIEHDGEWTVVFRRREL